VPFHSHRTAHPKSHRATIRFQSEQSRRQPAYIGEVPNEHEAFGFPFEAKPHRLDLVVRCDADYLSCSLGRVQASRQDFGCLAGAQLFAVLNPIEGELELRQENLSTALRRSVGVCGSSASVLASPCWTR